jgi:hypothetical protein
MSESGPVSWLDPKSDVIIDGDHHRRSGLILGEDNLEPVPEFVIFDGNPEAASLSQQHKWDAKHDEQEGTNEMHSASLEMDFGKRGNRSNPVKEHRSFYGNFGPIVSENT